MLTAARDVQLAPRSVSTMPRKKRNPDPPPSPAPPHLNALRAESQRRFDRYLRLLAEELAYQHTFGSVDCGTFRQPPSDDSKDKHGA